jgi:hypothetical protein
MIVMNQTAMHFRWLSRMPEEFQVERSKDQDNANIHHQPFPESMSEEHDVYSDYNGCHGHHVKYDS